MLRLILPNIAAPQQIRIRKPSLNNEIREYEKRNRKNTNANIVISFKEQTTK